MVLCLPWHIIIPEQSDLRPLSNLWNCLCSMGEHHGLPVSARPALRCYRLLFSFSSFIYETFWYMNTQTHIYIIKIFINFILLEHLLLFNESTIQNVYWDVCIWIFREVIHFYCRNKQNRKKENHLYDNCSHLNLTCVNN